MTRLDFLLQSLLYYWRTHLAVLLGVIAGTAVIGGALVVGDSVRESLTAMSRERLGGVDHVLQGQRFFREDLAEELAGDAAFGERFEAVAPGLVLQGSLEYGTEEETRRVNQVRVFGLDERGWRLTRHGSVSPPGEREILVNSRVAEALGVQDGDEVTLWVELPTAIPRESLFGERDELSRPIFLTVREVLPDELGVSRFSLDPNQQLPLTAFVALDELQFDLDLAAVPPSEEDPDGEPARVNSLFVSAKEPVDAGGAAAPEAAAALNGLLARHVRPGDLGLRIVANEEQGYLSLESKQQILPERFAAAGRRAAASFSEGPSPRPSPQRGEGDSLRRSPVFVYLANEIHPVGNPDRFSMYSIIGGLDFGTIRRPPFGPWTFDGRMPQRDDEILINGWLAEDLQAGIGDEVVVKYYEVGPHADLNELSRTFTVVGVAALEGAAADPGLTPEVEGITDAEDFADWDQPFPMQLDRVTDRDETYWDRYRATPKAFVTLETAQSLWGSRYGNLTSLRVAPGDGQSLQSLRSRYVEALMQEINLPAAGLAFQPTKFLHLQASSGTTDFSGLFIGFSFFLILAATILIGLLFRLGIERRAGSIGLLSAVGFSPGQVRRLFLGEGLLVVVAGALLGLAAAVGYAQLMVYGLKTWWFEAIRTRFLAVYLNPLSLALGAGIAVAVAGGAVWWALRQLRGLSTRELLAGTTQRELTAEAQRRRGSRARQIALGGAVLAGVLVAGALVGLIPNREAFSGLTWQVVTFFVVGLALLTASVAFFGAWIDSDRAAAVRGRGPAGLARLGLRNAARHRQRSLMTVGLIASAAFVIVAVGAGRRNPAAEEPRKDSGNGGFTLVAESTSPLLHSLNTEEGRRELGMRVDEGSPEAALLEEMEVYAFRVKPGQDASCLNIYQRLQRPTILGVPERFIERGGFRFVGADAENPWTVLRQRSEKKARSAPRGSRGAQYTVPVLGDMNSLMWSLKKSVGDTVPVPDAQVPDAQLKIAGMLSGSVFQSELLVSEENFLTLFPQDAGYEYFLIEIAPDKADRLSTLLETDLAEYGFDAERVGQRLRRYLAVQNTYLETFQMLGGLGLLLGTLGLATVMLRNVLERRSELALLRAVGFRNVSVAALVLWENAVLLAWGLAAGTASALLAMAPHLMSVGADVPWGSLGLILAGVFVVGTVSAWLAVSEAVRTPIVATLRSE